MEFQNDTASTESEKYSTVGVENIYPALVECFGIISLGYLAGRFRLLSSVESKGIETFVCTFALPAMIFNALCSLDLTSVNWKFLLSILITKSIIFITVLVITLVVNHGHNMGKAGLYSIFVTQSNDFALGFPILKALYGQTNPEYPMYLYLLSPISLAILNPIGCVLMEIDRFRLNSLDTNKIEHNQPSPISSTLNSTGTDSLPHNDTPRRQNCFNIEVKLKTEICDSHTIDSKSLQDYQKRDKIADSNLAETIAVESSDEVDSTKIRCSSKARTVLRIMLSIVSNPIIVLTIAGAISGQFIFNGKVPPVIDKFMSTLSNAFSATALFSLGIGMVGRMKALKSGSKLLGPFLLIATKIILMPLIARAITIHLNAGEHEEETKQLADFAFLYGTFPTAPTVYVLATRYGVAASIIASTMVACTFLSAPIVFVSAQLLAAVRNPSEYSSLLDTSLYDICIISLVAIIWTIFIMLYTSKRCCYMPHSQTLLLLISQGIACSGAIMFQTLDFSQPWTQYLQFSILLTGVYASRINAAIISVILLLFAKGKVHAVTKLQPLLLAMGVFVPAILVGVVFVISPKVKQVNGTKADQNFQFGKLQTIISLTVLAFSLCTIMLSMILSQRKYKRKKFSVLSNGSVQPTMVLSNGSIQQLKDNKSAVKARKTYTDESFHSLGLTPGKALEGECCNWKTTQKKKDDQRDYQMLRHTVLLIFIAISMVIGIALCTTTLLYDNVTECGIYFIIVFLDTSMNFGQGLMTCAVFGLESKYVFSPLLRWLRKIRQLYQNFRNGKQTE